MFSPCETLCTLCFLKKRCYFFFFLNSNININIYVQYRSGFSLNKCQWCCILHKYSLSYLQFQWRDNWVCFFIYFFFWYESYLKFFLRATVVAAFLIHFNKHWIWPYEGQTLVLLCFISWSGMFLLIEALFERYVLCCYWILSSSLYFFLFVSTVFLIPLLSFSLMEAKRSQSISNCVHLYEALPAAKSVPMLLHTVSSFLPGISSGNSACSHRLSGKVCSESCMCLCVCDLRPAFPSICHCYMLSVSVSVVTVSG